jgi:hypothetical protein
MEFGFNTDCGSPISMPRDTVNHAAPTGLDGLWCGVIYKHVAPDGAGMRLGRVFDKHAVPVVNPPPFFDDFCRWKASGTAQQVLRSKHPK